MTKPPHNSGKEFELRRAANPLGDVAMPPLTAQVVENTLYGICILDAAVRRLGDHSNEPFVATPYLAAVAPKIRFTTSVLKLAIRQPVIVAKQLSSLAVVTNNLR